MADNGICGITADTIAARNFAKMVAGGAAVHSEHSRDIVKRVMHMLQDKVSGLKIKDPEKLEKLSAEYNIETTNIDALEIAKKVSERALGEFGQQDGELKLIQRAPEKTKEMWSRNGLMPRGIDCEFAGTMSGTDFGADNDYRNIILHSMRASLADGWGSSMLATDFSDILFGSPKPVKANTNLGILKEDEVNIILNGSGSMLSEMIVRAAREPELLKQAEKAGAKGINPGGICSKDDEILIQLGIPIAGDFLQQELAIVTGATDIMVVGNQCIMPSIVDAAKCCHTVIVATSPEAKLPGTTFIDCEKGNPYDSAKEIVRIAIESFKKRDKKKVNIPDEKKGFIAGFTAENIFQILGGKYRATYSPLNNAIIEGRIRGVAIVSGCTNPGQTHDPGNVVITRELLRHDILVLATGCSAIECAEYGLLAPEAANDYAGEGLREVCEAVGIPPVLHLGSCLDNSRILITLCNVIQELGLRIAISDLPIAGCVPEWISESAVSSGFNLAASGIYVDMTSTFTIGDSENILKFLTEEIEQITGGKFAFNIDPVAIAQGMIGHIDKKREALKLNPMMYPLKDIAVEV